MTLIRYLSRLMPVILSAFLGLAGTVHAQNRILTGRVTDAGDNKGLPGVNVLIKGSAVGTTTNTEGNFQLNLPNGATTLVFSSVGYTAQETAIGNSSVLNITLQADTRSLNEVVVVGYGQKNSRKLTESIGTVQAKDITRLPVASPEAAIQGRVSGVQITNVDGTPGGPVAIRIRGVSTVGNNQPLFVVDGVPIGDGTGNQINPADIENISVLKDASSASIYGLRASNGVILITTKRGKSGKPRVNFDVYSGVQNFPKFYEMNSTAQYVALAQESFDNANNQSGAKPGTSDFLQLPTDLRPGGKLLGIDNREVWRDAVVQRNAPITNYNLSLSGGNENSNYFVSAGLFQQKSMVKKWDLTRYSFRINSDHRVGKRLKIGQALTIAYAQTERGSNAGGDGFLYSASATMPPFFSYRDENNSIPGNRYGYSGNASVAGLIILNTPGINQVVTSTDRSLRLLGNLYGELELIKGLKLRSVAALDFGTSRNTSWQPGYTLAELGQERNTNGYNDSRGEGVQQVFTNTLNYDGVFGSHTINAVAGMEYQQIQGNNLSYSGANYSSTDPNFYQSIRNQQGNSDGKGGFVFNNAGSGLYQRAYFAYFGRVSYDYKDKYLVTATARYDMSSNFAPENRARLFPAISAAWRISNEDFFKNKLPFITDLKLRGSWGQLGNDRIGLDFPYVARVSQYPWYTIGAAQTTLKGSGVPALINRALRWEVNESIDAGFDVTFFGKLNVLATYYNRDTKDFLYSLPVNLTSGFENIPVNLGQVNNRGIELETSYRTTLGKGATIELFGNITTIRNRLVALAPGVQEFINSDYRTAVGFPIGYFYGYRTLGIYQNSAATDKAIPDKRANDKKPVPGDVIFEDNNGPGKDGELFSGAPDGKIDVEDRTFLGKTIPDFFYGFGVNAGWKGFDLSLLFQGVAGASVYNQFRQGGENLGGVGRNQLASTANRWRGEGTSSEMPRATANDQNNNGRFSDRWVEDASFLRFKNVQLGYSLPRVLLDKIKVFQGARVYMAATNLFRITKYQGLDPEVVSFGNPASQLFAGTDPGNIPQPVTVQLGANLTF
ncbi:SusC/RagA family TonB-linked outer membrane protein [Fibrella aquatilis]|uniref:TonB-dependent receptor n=1 Tax=Fibrella aquatilis TaxID=2817059 RepID=A0A939GBL9_9BACT|nr:TonB-dependent receptor [Fibrella aquatilis]MBO0933870.1 TonB-dependent receptor [Fibrella aquatilis]